MIGSDEEILEKRLLNLLKVNWSSLSVTFLVFTSSFPDEILASSFTAAGLRLSLLANFGRVLSILKTSVSSSCDLDL